MAPSTAFESGGCGPPGFNTYYFSNVNFGAPPRSEPRFSLPIRPEPPWNRPCIALTAPSDRLSGTANGAGIAADGAASTPRTGGLAAAAATAAAAVSGRVAASFLSILWISFLPQFYCVCSASRISAVGRPRQLPGGAGRPRPGQVVEWGCAGGDASVADARGERRLAFAGAFCTIAN